MKKQLHNTFGCWAASILFLCYAFCFWLHNNDSFGKYPYKIEYFILATTFRLIYRDCVTEQTGGRTQYSPCMWSTKKSYYFKTTKSGVFQRFLGFFTMLLSKVLFLSLCILFRYYNLFLLSNFLKSYKFMYVYTYWTLRVYGRQIKFYFFTKSFQKLLLKFFLFQFYFVLLQIKLSCRRVWPNLKNDR